jgi:hypothetical protein
MASAAKDQLSSAGDQLSFAIIRAAADPARPQGNPKVYCLACAKPHTYKGSAGGGWRPATVEVADGKVQVLASNRVIHHRAVDAEEQALVSTLQQYHDAVEQELLQCIPGQKVFIKKLRPDGTRFLTAVCRARYQVGLLRC